MRALNVLLIVLVLSILSISLVSCRQTAPEALSVDPPSASTETSNPTLPSSTLQNEKETETITPTSLFLFLVVGEKKTFAYGIGDVLNPKVKYPLYEFPLFVSKPKSGGSWQTLAVISDPNIEQIGAEWESGFIKDPDYPNHLLKVKLVRVNEGYKYKVEACFSPDGGESWWKPATYPYPDYIE